MSIPPITIPELDSANVVDSDNDLILIRQGLNDKKVSVANLTALKLQAYPTLNRALLDTDVLLMGSNNGNGTYTNYTMDARRVGFLTGVYMWFYSNVAPLYWTNYPVLADRVLGVQGGGGAYQNVGLQGTWQQADAILNIEQIPSHSHYTDTTFGWAGVGAASSSKVSGGRNGGVHQKYVPSFPTGGQGSTLNTSSGNNDSPNNNFPNASGHNHGNDYRPAAAVGLVCFKSG